MEKMIRKVCEKAPSNKARELSNMKIQTINQIISKRDAVTRGVDKALREGKSIDDAISSYSNETTILCNKFSDAGSKMLTEFEEKKKEEKVFMLSIRARTQYAFVRALLSVEAAFHGEPDQPFYLSKEMSKNQWNIYKDDIRLQVGKYQGMMIAKDLKTWEKVEKLLKDVPKANVEPILFEYQQFLVELVEKAKKEGLEWKKKWDEAPVEAEAEIKEKVTVEKETEKEKTILVKKEEVSSKNELKVEKGKVTEEKVLAKQIDELKTMLTVMKEDMFQEFNKKFESAEERHKKEIEKVQKTSSQDYCRLEQSLAGKNEEIKRLNGVVESLNKRQEETENELEEVKKDLDVAMEEHNKGLEEIRKEIKSSRKEDQDYCRLKMKLAERDGQLKESRETIARYKEESREWKVKEQEQFERMGKNELELLKLSKKMEEMKKKAIKDDEKMRMELTKKVLEAEDSLEKLADSEEEVKRLNGIVEALNKTLEEMCESSEKMTLEMTKKQKETEIELEDVKSQMKEAKEELDRMQEDSGDSSFDQLDDSDN
uniref:Viral A-type inclusion protein n=1 Tax=Caenorhabditis tropicalis TaxID=1561998 RepID=A0A1I7UHA8_9PELO